MDTEKSEGIKKKVECLKEELHSKDLEIQNLNDIIKNKTSEVKELHSKMNKVCEEKSNQLSKKKYTIKFLILAIH